MAKKNYVHVEADFVPTMIGKGDQTEMVIYGKNTNGTDEKITVIVDNWMFPTIVEKMRVLLEDRISAQKNILSRIKNEANKVA